MPKLFNPEEQKYVVEWFTKADGYKIRAKITNFMKNFYTELGSLDVLVKRFANLSKMTIEKCLNNDKDKYILNAEKVLINCLKFDELDGFQGLLVHIFFLDPSLISKFWLFAFCDKPLSPPPDQAPSQNQNVQSNQMNPSYNTNYSFHNTGYYPYPPQQTSYLTQPNSYLPQQQASYLSQPTSYLPQQNSYLPQQQASYLSQPTSYLPQQNSYSTPNQIRPESQVKAENPDKCIDALCKVLNMFADEFSDETNNSREFINFFITRFLKSGLEAAANDLLLSRLKYLFEPLKRYLFSITKCGCEKCIESFINCSQAYRYFIESQSISQNDDLVYDVRDSLIDLLNLRQTNYLEIIIKYLIITAKPKFFKGRTIDYLAALLRIGLPLTNDALNTKTELLTNCMKLIYDIFNEEEVYEIKDSELITNCIRFFYLNRFYEPFHVIPQRILNSDLKWKIQLEDLEDIVFDIYLEEEEDNENDYANDVEFEADRNDKEYKEYIRLFNDLRGKGKKKKNEQMFNIKLVEENVKLCVDQAYLINVNNIREISPIAESCKASFQMLFRRQMVKFLNEQQNTDQNQKNEQKPEMNIFFEKFE
ncbi:hypothetical protein M9Y10_038614 [Tritrichomonas musculus]|uniref:Uncharacterized protein n=1 Tax=Tritrichomonas musculus TaxID=1915356 RepID=A0ABR2K8W1_9EUKA